MSDPSEEREFHLCQILDFDQSINQCLATFVLSFFHGFCLFIWLWRCKGQQQIKLIRCRSIEMTRSKIERRLLVKNNKEVQSFWRDLLSRFVCQFFACRPGSKLLSLSGFMCLIYVQRPILPTFQFGNCFKRWLQISSHEHVSFSGWC